MQEANICDRIEDSCKRHSKDIAIIDGAGNGHSFERIFYAIQSLAESLTKRGVSRGDFVANHMDDSATAIVIGIAILKLGAVRRDLALASVGSPRADSALADVAAGAGVTVIA